MKSCFKMTIWALVLFVFVGLGALPLQATEPKDPREDVVEAVLARTHQPNLQLVKDLPMEQIFGPVGEKQNFQSKELFYGKAYGQTRIEAVREIKEYMRRYCSFRWDDYRIVDSASKKIVQKPIHEKLPATVYYRAEANFRCTKSELVVTNPYYKYKELFTFDPHPSKEFDVVKTSRLREIQKGDVVLRFSNYITLSRAALIHAVTMEKGEGPIYFLKRFPDGQTYVTYYDYVRAPRKNETFTAVASFLLSDQLETHLVNPYSLGLKLEKYEKNAWGVKVTGFHTMHGLGAHFGLREGDRIVGVNGEETADFVALFLRLKNSDGHIQLTYVRDGVQYQTGQVSIERTIFPDDPVAFK